MKIYSYLACLFEAIENRQIPYSEIELNLGDDLFKSSQIQNNDLILVLSGQFQLKRQGGIGETLIEAGELLGDVTAFTGRPRSAQVKALKPSTVAVFNKNDFMHLLAQANAHGEYSHLNSYLEFMADRLIRSEAVFEERLGFLKTQRYSKAG